MVRREAEVHRGVVSAANLRPSESTPVDSVLGQQNRRYDGADHWPNDEFALQEKNPSHIRKTSASICWCSAFSYRLWRLTQSDETQTGLGTRSPPYIVFGVIREHAGFCIEFRQLKSIGLITLHDACWTRHPVDDDRLSGWSAEADFDVIIGEKALKESAGADGASGARCRSSVLSLRGQAPSFAQCPLLQTLGSPTAPIGSM